MNPTLPLSVCMIARDEEARIANAIGSVRGVAGEIIVVDTGSRDRTQQIAQELGARVLSCVWQDDFSLARNTALAAARYDWILSLDADQQLDAASLPALTEALGRSAMAQLVQIDLMGENSGHSPVSSFPSLRLFRRDTRIRFRGRVHEDVAGSLLEAGSSEWPDSGVRLRDSGYVLASERQKKRARNLRLLEQAHEEDPQNLFVSFKLATTLPAERRQERRTLLSQAMEAARALDAEQLSALPFRHRLFAEALDDLVEQGRLQEAATQCQRMFPLLGTGSCFAAGRTFARAGFTDLSAQLLQGYLDLPPSPPWSVTLPDLSASAAEACRWLAWIADIEGRSAQARSWLDRALQNANEEQTVAIQCDAIRLILPYGDLARVGMELQRLYPKIKNSRKTYCELMLLSAEVSLATGDRAGAISLARAAMAPDDDRPAALLAKLELSKEEANETRLRELLPAVVGRRFDTLAVRVQLAKRIGQPFVFPVPDATRRSLL
ncbi:MAG TPA: glycosyltransferase family 2 protein [Burkholderiaceae bacterium]|nr:glycosyltransferase family 2 protein [Burkholderiaceae bacterium]